MLRVIRKCFIWMLIISLSGLFLCALIAPWEWWPAWMSYIADDLAILLFFGLFGFVFLDLIMESMD